MLPLSPNAHNAKERIAIFNQLQEQCAPVLQHLPILTTLPSPPPKIVWWCWLQGEEEAPAICKICLKSIRHRFNGWKINVVTKDNLDSFISIPAFIKSKWTEGAIPNAHFTDIIRMCLLVEHGGLWLDATLLCTGLDQMASNLHAPLFFYAHAFSKDPVILGSNWLFSAQKCNPLLCTTRDLLFWFWQKHKEIPDYYIFHILFHIAALRHQDILARIPYVSNTPPHIMQRELFTPYNSDRVEQLKELSNFHKLTHKISLDKATDPMTLYAHLLVSDGITI